MVPETVLAAGGRGCSVGNDSALKSPADGRSTISEFFNTSKQSSLS
jgi:hypothetical protein